MRTLIISDLHLGDRFRRDVLRLPVPRERLLAAIRDADRLVLLGDTLELRWGARAMAVAEPVLREIGRALGPEREVIIVPGNHDARLARRWALAQERRLSLAATVDPQASRALTQLLSWLAPARARVSYPGVWLADGLWATHGHYLDRHLVPESAIGLPLHGTRPAPDHGVLPIDYERSHRRRRRRQNGERGGGGLVDAARAGLSGAVKKGIVTLVPGMLLKTGLAPVTAKVLGVQMRHAALPAMASVVGRLDVEAEWVLFGHVHHRGPFDGEAWRVDGATRYVNTGSWMYERLLVDRVTPPHPYWPGGAVILEDGAAPRSVGLLDDLRAQELQP